MSAFGDQNTIDGMQMLEMFFFLTITDDQKLYWVPVADELRSPQINFAEVVIPLDWHGFRVAATVYATNFPNDYPMVREAPGLQQLLPGLLYQLVERGIIDEQGKLIQTEVKP